MSATGGHGGKRNKAGRPRGAKSAKTLEIADRAAKEGLTPLEYMLSVMRDESQSLAIRLDAAKSCAPYIHPRLNAIDHAGAGGSPIVIQISGPIAGA